MTIADDPLPGEDGDDMLAAEYVLGTLSAEERAAVARRIDAEPAFARRVESWEIHLAPMAGDYPAVEPPASVRAAIERRLFGTAAQAPAPAAGAAPARGGFWASLAVWRGLTVAALAAFAFALVLPVLAPPPSTPAPRLVASLAADGSDVKYLVVYDAKVHDIALSHVSGERAAGHDFELWMIEGDKAPVSMGVIPVGASTRLAVDAEASAKLAQGAVLAVSLEPAGGSPTGKPTGPVVAAGDLRDI